MADEDDGKEASGFLPGRVKGYIKDGMLVGGALSMIVAGLMFAVDKLGSKSEVVYLTIPSVLALVAILHGQFTASDVRVWMMRSFLSFSLFVACQVGLAICASWTILGDAARGLTVHPYLYIGLYGFAALLWLMQGVGSMVMLVAVLHKKSVEIQEKDVEHMAKVVGVIERHGDAIIALQRESRLPVETKEAYSGIDHGDTERPMASP